MGVLLLQNAGRLRHQLQLANTRRWNGVDVCEEDKANHVPCTASQAEFLGQKHACVCLLPWKSNTPEEYFFLETRYKHKRSHTCVHTSYSHEHIQEIEPVCLEIDEVSTDTSLRL